MVMNQAHQMMMTRGEVPVIDMESGSKQDVSLKMKGAGAVTMGWRQFPSSEFQSYP